MRWTLVFLFMLLAPALAFSQDIIKTVGGGQVICKVIGVTNKDVKYKKPGPQNKQVLSLPLERVQEVIKDGKTIYPGQQPEGNKFPCLGESPSFLGFSAGASVPLGTYGALRDGGAGFALPGFSWHLDGAYFIKPFLGLGIKTGSFSNNTDEQAWQTQLEEVNSGFDINLNSGSWSNGYFLVGPYYSLVGDRVILDLNLMVGFVNTTDPSFDAIFFDNGSRVQWLAEQTTTPSFGFGFGAQTRIALTENLAFRLSGDFITAEPQIVTNIVQTIDGNLDAVGVISYRQSVSVVNLSGGFVYHFAQ